MAGDTLMDDPSSVKHFEDWMQTMFSSSQSKANGEIAVKEDAQKPAEETSPVVAPAPLELPQKYDDERETVQENEAAPSNKISHSEGLVQTPVVSVAYKAMKAAIPSPRLTGANDSDQDPKTDEARDGQTSMSPAQDVEALPEAPEKGDGLDGSIHARPIAKDLPPAYRRQYKNDLPATTTHQEGSISLRAGGKHDPMEYFDTKQKEYYPKPMLQSKDPNASMKSPKKPAKLNPKAKEYSVDATVAREEESQASNNGLDLTPVLNVLGARTLKASRVTPEVVNQKLEVYLNGGEGDDLEVDMGSLQGIRKVIFRFTSAGDVVAFRSILAKI